MNTILVLIKNLSGIITNEQPFNTLEEATAWIQEETQKLRPWNYAKEGEYTELPFGAVNYTEEDRTDEFGNSQHYYIVPKQYEVVIQDLTNDETYIKQNIEQVVQKAIQFGQKLSSEFIAENIYLGITQAGKTKDVRTALNDTFSALQTGSLYDAIAEARSVEYRDNTFVTDTRLLSFINKIESYLGMGLSTEV